MTEKYVDLDERFVVHPDAMLFRKNYQPGQKFGEEITKIRERMEADGEVSHNRDHDVEMGQTARDNTDNAISNGWRFPLRKKK